MSMFRRFRHWLSHVFGWNVGEVEIWYAEDASGEEVLMVGFRCDECGELQDAHEMFGEERR
jgi:hypothetical protein